MKKLLFWCLFALFFCSGFAQSQKQQESNQALVQRIDSLEHELSYLKLSYDLYTLNSDMKMATAEMNAKSLEIRTDVYHRNTGFEDVYQEYYETCERQKQAFHDLIEAKKEFFMLKVMSYPYSETELKTLKSSYKMIDAAYNTMEGSLKLLKVSVNSYRKLVNLM